jgi:hypothetical protein
MLEISDRLPLKVKVKTYANYVRHSLHEGVPIMTQAAQVPSSLLFWSCYPIGIYLKIGDRKLLRKIKSKDEITSKDTRV